MNRQKTNSGFTIIELLIALVLFSLVTTAIFQLYIRQHSNWMIQEDISDIQQNGRASLNEISRHVRLAGFDLPYSLDAIEVYDTNPDTIIINYRPENCDTYLSAAMPHTSAELKCATDVSCFYDGQWVYIFEPDSGGGEWFEITKVQAPPKHIQHNTMMLSKVYGKDAILLALTQIKFFVDNSTDPDHPMLMIQMAGGPPQIYADNIDDLQFQYVLKNGNISDAPVLIDNIREVRISISARSDRPDVEFDFENNGGYRTRSYSTSVNVRNMSS